MICSKCGTYNQDDAKFCVSCGSPLGEGIDYPDPAAAMEAQTRDEGRQNTQNTGAGPESHYDRYVKAREEQEQQFTASIPAPGPERENRNPMNPGPSYNNGQQGAPYYQYGEDRQTKENDPPISMWAYMGFLLLIGIPVAGLIVFLVLAFSGTNRNLQNFARGILLYKLLIFVVGLLLVILGTSLGMMMLN